MTPASQHLSTIVRDVDRMVDACEHSWQVGPELAKRWTEDDRTMTQEEYALTYAFHMGLDDGSTGTPFRRWWLDNGSEKAVEAEWLGTWTAAADMLEHPWAAAHLLDLLWIERSGERPYEFGRRASEMYRESAVDVDSSRTTVRLLFRSLELAAELNDAPQRVAAETALLECIQSLIALHDRPTAVWSVERLAGKVLTAAGEIEFERALHAVWAAVEDGHETETVAKVLIGRAGDGLDRESIAARAVGAFRNDSANSSGMRKLLLLREALRVAEEMGHPSYDEIVHEIETMDTEDVFQKVSTEGALKRSDVSDFCTSLVGEDSLEMALFRLVSYLPLTPEAVASIRENTQVGLRHLVQQQQIGEANSVVTSSATEEDSIDAVVDRDVRQQCGYHAQFTSLMYLAPALHQLLETYYPWSVDELANRVEGDTCDAVVASALVRSIEHFRLKRYDEAVHILVPRLERQVRQLARSCGVSTTKRPTDRVGGIRGLGEIVAELRRGRDGIGPLLPEPLMTSVELMLVDPDSINLRNDVAHGITAFGEEWQAALLIQLGLRIALTIQLTDPT